MHALTATYLVSLLGQVEPPIFIVHAEEGEVLGDERRAPWRQEDDPMAVARRCRKLEVALDLEQVWTGFNLP